MNTSVLIYERMTNKAAELYKSYVTSNWKLRQMESAMNNLKGLVANNGDIGMAYVMDMLEAEYQKEKSGNSKKCSEYYAYIDFVREYARNVKEIESIEVDDIERMMEKTCTEVRKELELKELERAEREAK